MLKDYFSALEELDAFIKENSHKNGFKMGINNNGILVCFWADNKYQKAKLQKTFKKVG